MQTLIMSPIRIRRAVAVALLVLAPSLVRAAERPARLAHFERMPKPATLPDGTLAAYFLSHDGPGLPKTPAVQRMTARYSRDHGRTWGEEQALFELPREAGGFGYFERLVDRDGEVHFFLLCDDNTGVVRDREPKEGRPVVEPIARQRLDVWHVRSTDGRTRWQTPRRIWEGRAGDLQSVTQLKSGRIVLPLSYYNNRNWGNRGEGFAAYTYVGQFDCTSLTSDDGGKTWQKSPAVLQTQTPGLSSYGPVEPVAIELTDGRVWMLLRTQLGRFFETFSPDGSGWSPPRPTPILSSDSPAGLLRSNDGRLVLIWNNCQRFPYAQGARNVLHAAISADEGTTWRGYREILRDPRRNEPPPPNGDHGVSYPFATLSGDGRVVYSLWVQTGEGRSLESFDPAWLLETSQQEDFARGLDAWSIFGTRGADLISHEQATDGHALSLGKADAAWPCAAVWNFPAGRSGTLRTRMRIEPESAGLSVQLADHFSVPFDDQDRFFSPFDLRVAADGQIEGGEKLPVDKWFELELKWDGAERVCHVSADGGRVATLRQRHETPGPSYLRLRTVGSDVAKGRALFDDVRVEVSP